MLVPVPLMGEVTMAIVDVVDVAFVVHALMTAARAMLGTRPRFHQGCPLAPASGVKRHGLRDHGPSSSSL